MHIFQENLYTKRSWLCNGSRDWNKLHPSLSTCEKALDVDPTEQYEYWQKYLQSIEAHYAHALFSRKPVHQKIMALQWQS
jgi:hypothetical protein